VLEDVVLALVERLHERTGEQQLCLAGGVAFNSVMNGRIRAESPFRDVFVQPAAGDAGCSLGAALLVHHAQTGSARRWRMEHAYLGPAFDAAACADALTAAGVPFRTFAEDELLPRVAQLLADGAVVGWFHGRAEFGPRALGSRSFLADPRDPAARQRLNEKVKLREWFRPLAPSLTEESAPAILGKPYRDPFMVTVTDVAPAARERIPAVVHVDGSARPQTVSRATNPRFWGLLREFERLTGVPVLLNTSFNVQEPIVLTPADAVRTYRASGLDVLVLGDHVAVRDGELASIASAVRRSPSSSDTRGA
jgi:carbamoyltransferase